jgi:restriction system protein
LTSDFPGRWNRAFEATLTYPGNIPQPKTHQLQQLLAQLEIQGTSDKAVHVDDETLFRQRIAQSTRYRPAIRSRTAQPYPDNPPIFPSFPDVPTPSDTIDIPIDPVWESPPEPNIPWYQGLLFWITREIRRKHQEEIERATIIFNRRSESVREDKAEIKAFNEKIKQLNDDRQTYWEYKKKEYDKQKASIEAAYIEDKRRWDAHEQAEANRCRQLHAGYERGTPTGLNAYFRAMLNSMPLPRWFARDYTLHVGDDGVMVIDLTLPYFDDLPVIKTRQLVSGNKQVAANKTEMKRARSSLPYLCALRYLWEIPKIDDRDFINYVCVNGAVEYDDPATGNRRRDTVLSVAATSDEIDAIQLDKVDPEACFRGLRGVSASKIDELVPIKPILEFDREDQRFREGEAVLDSVGDKNLATMDWQEFEHLIRELFEKVFAGPGAEVKVTQASRDRGVDAVIFDPDAIRGGKFVVQAKRYANVVDVSAVRDLYGTVMNEGASKGILVTTSNYGRDAYEFAKDKPLTLLNGQHLLHLLEKHGYRLRLDLKEARRLLKQQNRGSGA